MTRMDSAILMTKTLKELNFSCTYRLIYTTDLFRGEDVFSIFLSTTEAGHTDEEFVYDIAREKEKAIALFSALVHGCVTACTLRDVLYDQLAEA